MTRKEFYARVRSANSALYDENRPPIDDLLDYAHAAGRAEREEEIVGMLEKLREHYVSTRESMEGEIGRERCLGSLLALDIALFKIGESSKKP